MEAASTEPAPGFLDLQVNGCFGVDFNRPGLDPLALHHACEQLRRQGVAGILATVITDRVDAMGDRLASLVRCREDDKLVRDMIVGFHVEGPFLNEADGFRGAHPAGPMMPAAPDAMARLLDAGAGLVRLVTLAPERDPGQRTTAFLARQGVTVSAGHSDASLDELRAGLDAGLTMYTHLGNGCPMRTHRHDNIVQRVLALRDRFTISFIADGAHVPWFALRNYLALAGLERTVVVTDAIAASGLGPGTYTLGPWTVAVGADLVARAPDGSHLVGSASTMPVTLRNLMDHVGLTREQAMRLVVDNPRKAIASRGA